MGRVPGGCRGRRAPRGDAAGAPAQSHPLADGGRCVGSQPERQFSSRGCPTDHAPRGAPPSRGRRGLAGRRPPHPHPSTPLPYTLTSARAASLPPLFVPPSPPLSSQILLGAAPPSTRLSHRQAHCCRPKPVAGAEKGRVRVFVWREKERGGGGGKVLVGRGVGLSGCARRGRLARARAWVGRRGGVGAIGRPVVRGFRQATARARPLASFRDRRAVCVGRVVRWGGVQCGRDARTRGVHRPPRTRLSARGATAPVPGRPPPTHARSF